MALNGQVNQGTIHEKYSDDIFFPVDDKRASKTTRNLFPLSNAIVRRKTQRVNTEPEIVVMPIKYNQTTTLSSAVSSHVGGDGHTHVVDASQNTELQKKVVPAKTETTGSNKRNIIKTRARLPKRKQETVNEQVNKGTISEPSTNGDPHIVNNKQANKRTRSLLPKIKAKVRRKAQKAKNGIKNKKQGHVADPLKVKPAMKLISTEKGEVAGDGFSKRPDISKSTVLSKKTKRTKNSRIIKKSSKKTNIRHIAPKKTSHNGPVKRNVKRIVKGTAKRAVKRNVKRNSFPTKQKSLLKSSSLRARAKKSS